MATPPRDASLPQELSRRQSLRRAGLETLEAKYHRLMDLRLARQTELAHLAEQSARLHAQGDVVLGAVRVASSNDTQGQALQQFAEDAQGRLQHSQDALKRQIQEVDSSLSAELDLLTKEIEGDVKHRLTLERPTWEVSVLPVGGDRRIVHARRLSEDAAVLSLYALTQHIPSRYGFLGDDSTDDPTMVPGVLYLDEGISDVRPSPLVLSDILKSAPLMWPVKGMIPFQLPSGLWARWLSRGAVLEAELASNDGFRNVLTTHECAEMVGVLLKQHLAGLLELELLNG